MSNENKENEILAEYSYQEVYTKTQEEPIGIKKMKENYLFFILLSIIFGTIYTICLYKNISGITTPIFEIVWIISLTLALNKLEIKIPKSSFPYMIIILLFSISTILTTSGLIIVLNWLTIFLLSCMILLECFFNTKKWQFLRYFIGIFSIIGNAIVQIFSPFIHLIAYRKAKTNNNSKLKYVLIGLIISIPLVFMILILLSSADSIFSSIFINIFRNTNFGDIFGVSFLFCFGSFGFYAVLAGLYSNKIKNEEIDMRNGEPVIAITITSILTVIYLVFCLIQVVYLFIGGTNALPDGFTYSSYARRGFFQLLFVSIINFAIVLICIRLSKESKALKIILSILTGCTYILIASSAYRMILYVQEFNLTFLRILVLWFLALETVLMTGIFIAIFNKKFNLFRFSFISVIVFYLVFSFAKPDQIIAKYNVNHIKTLSYSDILYMVDDLSYDAAPVVSNIDFSKVVLEDGEYNFDSAWLKNIITNYFSRAKENYNDRGIRGFNFSSFDAKNAANEKLTF